MILVTTRCPGKACLVHAPRSADAQIEDPIGSVAVTTIHGRPEPAGASMAVTSACPATAGWAGSGLQLMPSLDVTSCSGPSSGRTLSSRVPATSAEPRPDEPICSGTDALSCQANPSGDCQMAVGLSQLDADSSQPPPGIAQAWLAMA